MKPVTDLADYADKQGIKLPCRYEDPEVMFPDDDLPNDDPLVEEAKAVCRRCPLRAMCLDGALSRREPHGVWGGATRKERDAIMRKHYRTLVQDEMLEVSV